MCPETTACKGHLCSWSFGWRVCASVPAVPLVVELVAAVPSVVELAAPQAPAMATLQTLAENLHGVLRGKIIEQSRRQLVAQTRRWTERMKRFLNHYRRPRYHESTTPDCVSSKQRTALLVHPHLAAWPARWPALQDRWQVHTDIDMSSCSLTSSAQIC